MNLQEPHVSREDIQKLIGIKPKNIDIYRESLVHKSIHKYIIENNITNIQDYMKQSFEKLEFLGDSVFNLIVTDLIYDKYPNEDEGFMTRLRTKIVRGSSCVKLAKIINLGQYILTKVKDENGNVTNEKILEDSFESLIGAIYKDLGFQYAKVFILKLIDENINFDSLLAIDDNYKDILMRYTQSYNYELPIYNLVSIDQNKVFTVSLHLKKDNITKEYGVGTGLTKKEAEQNACKNSICYNSSCYCNKIHMNELYNIINRTKK